jgi:hypothetical protein
MSDNQSTTETLQEILEVNPNAKKKADVVEDTTPSSYEWTAEEENADEKL